MPSTDPTPARPAVITAEDLPDDVGTLQRLVLELLASLQEERRDKDSMRHRIEQLLRRLYGPRGERVDPNQLLLFVESMADQDTVAEPPPTPAKPRRRCRPHGRRRLPDNLPREPRHHELSEAERICQGCGGLRVDIGSDRSEQLDYRPASLLVIEHFVHKYVCPCCSKGPAQAATQPAPPSQESLFMPAEQPPSPEPASAAGQTTSRTEQHAAVADAGDPGEPAPRTSLPEPPPVVLTAPRPAMPIAKGLPGPGLLAHLIVSKYTDYLPLYRLQRIYERQGLFLHRSTLSDWLGACADVLRPLYDLMVLVALQSRALHTDDTTVKLQDPETHHLSTARLWAYLGDVDHPYNVFDFTPNRKRDGPQRFLANYQGYLHADAFAGYDGLYLPDPGQTAARIIEVACNAHARRKFYEARGTDALRAHQALAYYGQLYELERSAKDFSDAQRLQMRQELSLPILEKFHQWLEAQRPQVLPKSPMAEALGYALNQWAALKRYTEAGFLSIDNNASEREMKRIAIGRKNWLTIGSERGGATAAVLMSFTSTCQRLGVEPWAYLQDVLTRLPSLPAGRLGELLPDRWQAARRDQRMNSPPAPPEPNTSATETSS